MCCMKRCLEGQWNVLKYYTFLSGMKTSRAKPFHFFCIYCRVSVLHFFLSDQSKHTPLSIIYRDIETNSKDNKQVLNSLFIEFADNLKLYYLTENLRTFCVTLSISRKHRKVNSRSRLSEAKPPGEKTLLISLLNLLIFRSNVCQTWSATFVTR